MNRAVVTGAGGFIGRALTRGLVSRGFEVTAVSRRPIAEDGCVNHVADIRESDCLQPHLCENTIVFHMAGHTSVSGSVRNPRKDFDANVGGLLSVLETARHCGARVVFPSSPAVFEPGQALPLPETARRGPVSPYGAAKLAGEGYARTFHACYGLDARIARIFNVYGPGMTRFAIFDFYRKLTRNPDALELLGDGEQLRDYLFLDDAVTGLILIALEGKPGEDYNLASGTPTRTQDLATGVARAMGLGDVQISARGESFPGDIAKWFADISKIRALGFEPTVTLEDGLARTVAWLATQGLPDPNPAAQC